MSSTGTSSQQQLSSILKGDLSSIKKANPVIVTGPRVRNQIWRNLVSIYRKSNLSSDEIISKILDYDKFVEEGKVTNDSINKAKGGGNGFD